MDRREKRTYRAVYDAFAELLQEKPYSMITVQEIIQRADVGRSTFYSHFGTKDELLEQMCENIFRHIFAAEKKSCDLRHVLTQLFFQLRDCRAIVTGMVNGESRHVFLAYLAAHLNRVMEEHIPGDTGIEPSYLLDQAVHGIARTAVWWVKEDMKTEPEKLAEMYMYIYPWLV